MVSLERSYSGALEAAGAKVSEFKAFGSYQGDWWAKVELPSGQHGWINGSYGSCAGCDALEAEFGDYEDVCSEHQWCAAPPHCTACDEAKAAHARRFAAFGVRYLDGIMTQPEAEAKAKEHIEWDHTAVEMVAFIKRHAVVSEHERIKSKQTL